MVGNQVVGFVLLTCLHVVVGSHFRGAIFTWKPTGNGTEILISYRISWRRTWSGMLCTDSTVGSLFNGEGFLGCYSRCIMSEQLSFYCTDFSTADDWTTGRNSFNYDANTTGEISFGFSGGAWIGGMNVGGGSWRLVVIANLSVRAETGTINSSPTVEVSPIVELKYGCSHELVLPVYDADGDTIKCRYANSTKNECAGICDGFPGSSMDEDRCILSYLANDSTGYYPVALQIEDFESANSSLPLSSIPVQFLVYVYTSTGGCGSRPEFILPTPTSGQRFCLQIGNPFYLNITATSSNSLSEITTISPVGLKKTNQTTWRNQTANFMSIIASWTPASSNAGEHSFCFTPKDSGGSTGEQRCVLLFVSQQGSEPTVESLRKSNQSVGTSGFVMDIIYDTQITPATSETFIYIYYDNGTLLEKVDASSSDAVVSDRQLSVSVGITNEELEYYLLFNKGIVIGTDECNSPSQEITNQSEIVLKACSAGPQPDINGYSNTTHSNSSLGGIVYYSCNTGYKLNGSNQLECLLTGEWSSGAPQCDQIDCGPPPDPYQHGIREWSNETVYGTLVKFACIEGYTPTLTTTLECDVKGLWNGSVPSCQIIDCGNPPPANINGTVTVLNTTYGSAVNYTCIQGLYVVGNDMLICNSSAQWNGSSPVCSEIGPCGDPHAVKYGSYNVTTGINSEVSYRCDLGYRLVGDSYLMCQADGSWNGSFPICNITDCGYPNPSNPYGSLNFTDTIYGSTAQYTCKSGYRLSGDQNIHCGEDGMWNGTTPDCFPTDTCNSTRELDIVFINDASGSIGSVNFDKSLLFINDIINRFDEASTQFGFVTYNAFPYKRFDLNSNKSLSEMRAYVLATSYPGGGTATSRALEFARISMFTKINGKRDTATHVAIAITDGKSNDPQATKSEAIKLQQSGVIIFAIGVGNADSQELEDIASDANYIYKITDYDNIFTTAGPLTDQTCSVCTDPQSPHTSIDMTLVGINSTITVECQPGYVPVGDSIIYCDINGMWNGSATCEAIDCGNAPSITQNGSVQFNGTKYRDVALYYCNAGYILKGPTSVVCQTSGFWNDSAPYCQPEGIMDCGQPPAANPYGSIQFTRTYLGSAAVYSCNVGYEQIGDAYIVCKASGFWNGTTPQCYPKETCVYSRDLDIVFINDASGSIGFSDFQTSLYFVNDIVNRFDPTTTRFGLVSFNDLPRLQYHLNEYINQTIDLVSATLRTSYNGGGTSTHLALAYAREQMFSTNNGMRPNSTQVAIVVTDGLSSRPQSTSNEAEELHAAGVTVFSIGIGNANLIELQEIASSPDYIFHVSKYEDILTVSSPLSNKTCTVCSDPRSPHTLSNTTDFSYNTTVVLNCSEGYDLEGDAEIFCDDTGSWNSSGYCVPKDCGSPTPQIVNGSSQIMGTTFGQRVIYVCDVGYRLMGSDVLECQSNRTWNGSTPSCIPTGIPDCGPPPPASPYGGIEFTSTTVGSSANYTCRSGYTLQGGRNIYCHQNKTWNGTTPECIPIETCDGERGLDIVFVNDASGSIGSNNFQTSLQFIADVVRRFDSSITRFGLVTFNGVPSLQFHLDEYVNLPDDAISKILSTSYTKGGTSTHLALEYTRINMLKTSNGMRQNATSVVIVITDGYSSDATSTIKQAEYLHRQGVVVISIGVGNADENELAQMASVPEYVFEVKNYDDIFTVSGPLLKSTCSACADPRPVNGFSNSTKFGINETLTLICNDGYNLIGNSVLSCNSSGLWNGSATCLPKDCGLPKPLQTHGSINFTSTTYGSSVVYTCPANYVLKGASKVFCDAYGNWNGTAPECIPLDTCNSTRELDIVFINDGSGSVGRTNFDKSLLFVNDIISRFNGVSTQFGFVSYNSIPYQWFDLNSNKSLGDMRTSVLSTRYLGGGTATDRALEFARVSMFASINGKRDTATQIVIVITDGMSNSPQLTKSEAIKLRQDGVVIFTIGVGNADSQELEEMASDASYIYKISDYDNIFTASSPLTDRTCSVCTDPRSLHTSIDTTQFKTNTTIKVECKPGYVVAGDSVIHCDNYGVWNGSADCDPIDCGQAPVISQNGSMRVYGTKYLDIVKYDCKSGYLLKGTTNIVCQANGFWNGSAPYCQPEGMLDCGQPPAANPYGGILFTRTYLGAAAVYNCNVGYELIGNKYIVCKENGIWNGTTPNCYPKEICKQPRDLDIVFINDASGSIGLSNFQTSLHFVNDIVNRFDPSTTRFGLVSFNDLPRHQYHLNEYINRPMDLKSATLRTSYNGGGTSTYLALAFAREQMFSTNNGMRANSTKVAIVVTDGQSSRPQSTSMEAEELHVAGVTVFSIGIGNANLNELQEIASSPDYVFQVSNYNDILKVSSPLSNKTCTVCSDPRTPYTLSSTTDFSYNTTTILSCSEGYDLEGDAEIFCDDTGSWNSSGYCVPKDCGLPTLLMVNGSSQIIGTTFGQRIVYVCDIGYRLMGSEVLECQANGTWNGSTPSCIPTGIPDCGPPPAANPYGGIEFTSTTVGSSANYTCRSGYTLQGDRSIHCLTNTTWNGTTPQCIPIERCDGERDLDIVFVNDASGSIGSNNFQTSLQFIADVVRRFDPSKTRFGLVTFNSVPSLQFHLNEYVNVPDDAISKILSTSYTKGGTSTHLALEYARMNMLKTGNGMRQNATSVVIVITDGYSSDATSTIKQAEFLHKQGVVLIPIGVGNADENELTQMASVPEYVFEVKNYGDIFTVSGPLLRSTCTACTDPRPVYGFSNSTKFGVNETVTLVCNDGYFLIGHSVLSCNSSGMWNGSATCLPKDCGLPKSLQTHGSINFNSTTYGSSVVYTCPAHYILKGASRVFCDAYGNWNGTAPECIPLDTCNSTRELDIVFINDGSGSVGRTNFDKSLLFVNDIISRFDEASTQFGFVTYNSIPYQWFDLNSNQSLGDMRTFILSTRYLGGSTATDRALEFVRVSMFASINGKRDTATQIVIVITDGMSNSPQATKSEAIKLRQNGVVIFAIGVGNADTQELEEMASDASYIYKISDYDNIFTASSPLTDRTCSVCTDPRSLHTSIDTTLFKTNTTIKVECKPGYVVAGDSVIHCDNYGVWNGSADCDPIDCGQAPAISQNGSMRVYGTKYLDIVKYDCNSGHLLKGPTNIVCQADGFWNGSAPYCQPEGLIDCGQPPAANPYGGIQFTRTYLGAAAVYNCNVGYELIGDKYIVCKDNGIWNGTTPNCTPKEICKQPRDLDIVFINDASGSIGLSDFQTSLHFVNDIVNRFDPATTRFGLVSFNDLPRIQYHLNEYINQPMDLKSATLRTSYNGGGTSTHLALAYAREQMFSTNNGMRANSTKVAIVVTDGQSSRPQSTSIDAEELHVAGVTVFSIVIGNANLNELKEIASSPDYVFHVSNYNDILTVSSPLSIKTCRICSDPRTQHTLSSTTDFSYNTTVILSCSEGYDLEGDAEIFCDDTGSWNSSGYCVPKDCGSPSQLMVNGSSQIMGTTFGQRIVYVCDVGYRLVGAEVLECQANGTWNGSIPSCIPTGIPDCGPPPPANPYGGIEFTSTTVGSSANYTCRSGYILQGDRSIHCLTNTTWNGTTPKCIPIDTCDGERDLDIVFVNDASGSIGSNNFQTSLQFIVDVVRRFDPSKTRFGLVTFNSVPNLQFHLDEYVNEPDDAISKIRSTSYTRGGTSTHLALEYIRMNMLKTSNGMRQNATSVVIVITDGYSSDATSTIKQAEFLHRQGVVVISIGVGNADEKELTQMASVPEYVFEVKNYDDIFTVSGPLLRSTCTACTDPRPVDGFSNSTKFGINETLTLICNDGYYLIGDSVLSCNSSGVWNGSATCLPKDCGLPKLLQTHGSINFTSTTYGSSVVYTCPANYILKGASRVFCDAYGNWNGTAPECIPLDTCNSTRELDIVFINDGSGSVGRISFDKSLLFVNDIISRFNKASTKFGFVSYNSIPYQWFDLNSNKSIDDLRTSILSTRYLGGGTATDRALEFARVIMFASINGKRDTATQIVIVITDGMSNSPQATKLEARKLQQDGVVIFAIGVGNADSQELEELASDASYIYKISDYDNIFTASSPLTNRTCSVCTDPRSLHTSIDMTQFKTNTTIKVECKPGYVVAGDSVIHCDNYGVWNGSADCDPIDCGQAPVISQNGSMRVFGTKYLDIVKYDCNSGYLLKGTTNIVCQADGFWNGSAPYCQPEGIIDCGQPPAANPYGGIQFTRTYSGAAAVYNCNVGYELIGDKYIVCKENGIWNGTTPNCTPKEICKHSRDLDIVFINDASGSIGFSDFQTSLHFLNDIVNRFDPATTRFGLVSFNDLPRLQYNLNEYINRPMDLKSATLRTSYNGGGTSTHLALAYARDQMFSTSNGMRANSTKVAIVLTDGQSSRPQSTTIEAEELHVAGVTVFSIGIGNANLNEIQEIASSPDYVFHVSNYNDILTVSSPLSNKTCTVCSDPRTPHTLSSTTDFSYNTTVLLSCSEGYDLEGDAEIFCDDTGSWNSSGYCVPKDCGSPTLLMVNGSSQIMGTTFGQRIVYVCDVGYRLVGSAVLECQANGTWNGSTPSCIPTGIPDCGPPPPANPYGGIDFTSTTVGSSANYTCRSGYNLQGDRSIYCQTNTTWNGTTPHCIPIDTCDGERDLDIVFVNDASGSIGSDHFQTSLQFIADVVRRFDSSKTRFGLVTFNSVPSLQFHLDEYVNVPDDAISKIRSTSYTKGGTSTHLALEYTRMNMLKTGNGMRQNATSVVIVITDGYSSDATSTIKQAEYLHRQGVVVISIGVGNADKNELTQMASVPEYVFEVKNYDDIFTVSGPLLRSTCAACPDPRPVDGFSNSTKFGINETLTLICNDGYYLIGDSVLSCNSRGLWNGSATCLPKDCGLPTSLQTHGSITFTSTTYGSSVVYTCPANYVLKGASRIFCDAYGNWNGSAPECISFDTCNSARELDIVFINDGSGSVGPTNFDKSLLFVNDIISRFNESSTQFGFVSYNSIPYQWFDLNSNKSLGEMRTSILSTSYLGGGTATHKALEFARVSMFASINGKRDTATQIVIVITDGMSNSPQETKSEAIKLRQEGVIIFAIGVGNADSQELEDMASDAYYIYEISDYDNIFTASSPLTDLTCSVCTDPRSLHTSIDTTQFKINGAIKVECKQGYVVAGDSVIHCDNYGVWNGSADCDPIDCGQAPVISQNGSMQVYGTKYLDVVEYNCNSGYLLKGTTSIVCQADGFWNGTAPYCQPEGMIDCGQPPAANPYGSIQFSRTYSGAAAVYNCNVGYELIGDKYIVCTENGFWNGTTPNCYPKEICKHPRDLDIVFINDASGSIGLSDFQTSLHFVNDIVNRFDPTTTRFGLVSFNNLPRLQYHLLEYINRPMDLKSATLRTSYNGGGTSTHLALAYAREHMFSTNNGMRANSTKIAIVVTDGQSSHPQSTSIEAEELHVTGVTVFSIGIGSSNQNELQKIASSPDYVFHVSSYKDILTVSNPLSNKTCTVCGDPRPPHTVSNATHFSYNTTVTLSCAEGYDLEGDAEIFCDDKGSWNSSGYCVPKDCGSPSQLLVNGSSKTMGTTFGKRIIYACDVGYRLMGSEVLECQANGTWNGTIPSCIATGIPDCGSPPAANPYGSIEYTSTTVGSSANYTCRSGYNLQGDRSIYCQTNKTWNGTTPKCFPIETCEGERDLDIVFVNDASGSIGLNNFQTSLQFISDAVRRFDSSKSRFGLVTFNSVPSLQFHLDHYINVPEDVISKILSTRYTKGGTSTHLALEYTRVNMLKTDNGMRQNATSVVIVITDGYSSDATSTIEQAKYLHRQGVVVISIGVGNADENELTQMASVPEYVFKVKNYGDIFTVSGPLLKSMCSACADPRPVNGFSNSTNFGINDTITLICKEGHSLIGDSVLSCDSKGLWNGSAVCLPKDCGDPDPMETYGSINYTNTTFGSLAVYSCPTNYKLTGTATVKCDINGKWNETAPMCIPLDSCRFNRFLDIVIVADTSDNIDKQTIHMLPIFINDMISRFNSSTIRIGLLTFGECIHLHYHLNALINGVGDISWISLIGGERLTHEALKYTKKYMFMECNGMRSEATQIAVLITQGESKFPESTIEEAKHLHNEKVTVFVINTGTIEEKEHEQIASSPDYVFGNQFIDITEATNTLFEKLCDVCASPLPVHGLSEVTSYSINSTINMTCQENYVLLGDPVLFCDENGKWNGSTACEIIRCPNPTPSNGTTDTSNFTVHSNVTVSCDWGFIRTGEPRITCRPDGTWSDVVGCIQNGCLDPMLVNGVAKSSDVADTSILNIECNEGYTRVGSENVTCLENGTWSDNVSCIIECSDPTPSNGSTDNRNFYENSTVKIECQEGFMRMGPETVTCQKNGTWTGTAYCVKIECPDPKPRDGYISGDDFSNISSVRVVCNEGFVRIGNEVITCLQNATWSDGVACIAECSNPTPINGEIDGQNFLENSTLAVTCNEGFARIGPSTVTCTRNRTWTGAVRCEKIVCSDPTPSNGFVTGEDFSYNSTVKVWCNNGFVLQGTNSTTCLSNGSWSSQLLCIAECQDPTPMNGSVNTQSFTENTTVTIICDGDFLQIGPDTVTCQPNGTWSNIVQCVQLATLVNLTCSEFESQYGTCSGGLTCEEKQAIGPRCSLQTGANTGDLGSTEGTRMIIIFTVVGSVAGVGGAVIAVTKYLRHLRQTKKLSTRKRSSMFRDNQAFNDTDKLPNLNSEVFRPRQSRLWTTSNDMAETSIPGSNWNRLYEGRDKI